MIRVEVPATSANCCVGFDCLGLALDWKASFAFEPGEGLQIEGCPAEFQGPDNLVIQAFDKTCQVLNRQRPGLHLIIDSKLPFARGLGSSSACVAAGILAANAWFGAPLSREQMLALAVEMEGHPDNAAPAIYGGMVCCFNYEQDGRPEGFLMELRPRVNWHALAIIPPYPVSTPEARRLLPETISLRDAASQSAHAIAFMQMFLEGNEAACAVCCADYLHEPYRAKLIKEYGAIKEKALALKMPMWISGSGSTMLVMSTDPDKLDTMQKWLAAGYPDLQLVRTSPDLEGAVVHADE